MGFRGHTINAVLAVLAIATVIAGRPAPAAAATPPRGFFGVGGWSAPTATQADVLATAGLGLVRSPLDWNEVEPTPGARNWASVDRVMASAAGRFDVLMVFNGCAAWACGAVHRPPVAEPAASQYRAFVRDAVARYGAGGSFWSARGISGPPRVMWQVWNEVNGGLFWPNPTPAGYASFLASISGTIKGVDPGATVVTSGLVEKPGDAGGVPLETFLDGLYAQPGYQASFDVQAVHGYAPSPEGTFHILDAARRIMLEHGDGGHPLWVTEMSWATGGPPHPFTVDEATQALYLQTAWSTMYACRQRWNLQEVSWFGLQDVDPATMGAPDYWGFENGLWRRDGSPKPAVAALLASLAALRLPNGRDGECPLANGTSLDIADPETTITSLPGAVRGGAPGTITFTSDAQAGDPSTHFECTVDGGDWAPCTSPLVVTSAREGRHDLRVRAIDGQGNADGTPATGSWMVDRSPPSTTLRSRTPHASGNSRLWVAFYARDAVAVGRVECRYDKTTWKPCASPFMTPALRAGAHVVAVRAIDTAGQADPTPLTLHFVTGCRYPRFATSGRRIHGPACGRTSGSAARRAALRRRTPARR